ncbi:hypothetical protein RJ639_046330 [Escallonia herrerae]|uniref:ABC1 atypical kinase-like domain-containing protein n=1 Tax=Escallonia herrerae TaxID=1293975 RepID=A0AA89B0E0_9ASTE|nr:hypothetical protein RJ639_046330 [Escallonia herrerae]
MAATIASHSSYFREVELKNQGRTVENVSFSSSISIQNFTRFERHKCNLPENKKVHRLHGEMRQTKSPMKVGTDGRPIKMVPTSEVMKRKNTSLENAEIVNGSKRVINGAGLVKKETPSALVQSPKNKESKGLPQTEELKVLPSDEGFSWANDNYNSIQRSIDVWSFVLSLRVRVLLDNAKWAYLGGFTEDKQIRRRRKTASWLRECVLQLGPTFIKLGQLSSTRSDLFPREFVDELAKLQDRVPAFSPEKAKNFIEKELGAPVDIIFKEFEDRPIAAASLGQVHRAILHNGEQVVVKVQRPGLKKLFDIDLRNLKLIAEYFQQSETLGGVTRDWLEIYEECAKILYEEIDYINEGKNADRFRRDFRNVKWVRVPLVFWDYTASKVLTLEYVPGIKINSLDRIDARRYSRSQISSRAVEAYLIQILKTGFFHADPHPGNLAIGMGESLIYYDFGMMGEIKSFTREKLLDLFYSVYEKDAKKVMQSLIDLEALQPTGDMSAVRRSVQFFLDNLLSQTADQQQTFAAIGEDLFAIATDQPLRFPSTLTFVLKAFSTLEGIGYILDPDFSFAKIAAPYAQELLDIRQQQRSGTPLVQEIRKQADDARTFTMSMPYKVQRIEEFVKQLESGDVKLRVRVLESERAARKATIVQMATMYTVLGGTLLNLGVASSNQGGQVIANISFVGAGLRFLRHKYDLKAVTVARSMLSPPKRLVPEQHLLSLDCSRELNTESCYSMAAILASHSSYCRDVELKNQGRTVENLSFSCSISIRNFTRFERHEFNLPENQKFQRFQVEMRQTESPMKVGTNGRPIKMVPTNEIMKRKNESLENAEIVNGSKSVINGAGLVKRETPLALAPSPKNKESKGFPPTEELKVLPSDEGFSWANENYNSIQRSIDVWSFVLSLRVRVLLDNAKWAYLGGFTEDKQISRRRKTASWLRECVLQLGPTFIKLGQLSSTRSDLFPREFVDELAKLQDRVPAFSPEKARNFIEKELGAPVDIIFKEFEDQPIAAASLGQVHRAILHNGEQVVVKVQRPGLKKLFDIDLRNLKLIAEYFQQSETLGGPTRDWLGIYEECAKILYEEIDYINEGKNADRFRRDFRNVKWVRVPLVFWDYTASKVLTLEYVPGIKINSLDMIDARGFSRSQISSRAIEAYLIQILKTGFFHADPHPGNLAIDGDESLIYYDFGMMGEIKSFTRERLLDLFYSVYEKDAKKVMQSLIDLEALQPTGDMSAVRRSVQFFLDNLLSQTPDQQQTLAAIGEDLFAIATDQPFRFPSTFTFVIRAFSTLEGIGYILDPDFSFVKIAAPYAQELLDIKQQRRSGTQLVQEIRKQADDARTFTMSMPYRVQRIEEFVKQLESGDVKLRVRVLESERAARKATILQMATMYTVLGGTLLNIGVAFSNQGGQVLANGSFVGAGVLLTLLIRSMQRVNKLDKFEKMI